MSFLAASLALVAALPGAVDAPPPKSAPRMPVYTRHYPSSKPLRKRRHCESGRIAKPAKLRRLSRKQRKAARR